MGRDVAIALKRGSTTLELRYPAALATDLAPAIPAADEQAVLAAALDQSDLAARAAAADGEIAVVISDVTRPTPSDRILPAIVDRLGGARPVILVAAGNHRPHSAGELAALVGGLDLEVVDHDHRAADLVAVGTTARGTPIALSKRYCDAALTVIVGHVAFHPFAGYSGGAKLVVPGLASNATIEANHAMATLPEATSGRIDGNPVRADLEEGFAMRPADLAVHVVLDLNGRIAWAGAGDPTATHRAAVRAHDAWYRQPLAAPVGAAVVSPGGYPKDIDFRQSSKALEYAARATRPGGELILVASCADGVGAPEMEALWRGSSSPEELIAAIERDAPPGAQRVHPIAVLCRDYRVSLYSDLPDELVRALHVTPIASEAELQARLDDLAARGVQAAFLPTTGIEPVVAAGRSTP